MDIVFSSTTQLAAAIRAGHVSATEVLQAHLAQIDRYNPTVNAVILRSTVYDPLDRGKVFTPRSKSGKSFVNDQHPGFTNIYLSRTMADRVPLPSTTYHASVYTSF